MHSGLTSGLVAGPLRTSRILDETAIAGGATGRVLYNNAGLIGQYVISGTDSVAMTNTPTLVTPVLGDATGTSITVSDGVFVSGANGYIEASGANSFIEAIGVNAYISSRSIKIWNGSQNTILAQSAATSDKTATFPNFTGTVAVTSHSATTTHAMFSAGAAGYTTRAIATADIATALTTPGAIGGTTAATSVKIANGSAASTALQIGAVSNGIYSPSGAGTDVGISANGALVAFWNSGWGLVALQPIIPNSNNLTSVGTSSFRWSNVFSVLGNFSGAVTCSTTLAVTTTTTLTGLLTANGGITVVGGNNLLTTNTALTGYSGSSSATMYYATDSPVSGEPSKWITINDNGTTRYIPTWT